MKKQKSTIKISNETKELLSSKGKKGDTYEEIILRMADKDRGFRLE